MSKFGIAGLVLIALALAASVIGLLVAVPDGPSDTQVALAYACGYRNGQIGITSRLPSLFTTPEDRACIPDHGCDCPAEKAIAAKHGFDPDP